MKGIAVAPEPLAAKAAEEVYREGGNAVDAAVAVSFAQGAVDPLMCGLGGTALMYLRLADGRALVIDGSTTIGSVPPPESWRTGYVGRSETVGRYIIKGELNSLGYASVGIPGFVRTAWDAYRKYGSGKVSWGRLLEPAIKLAEEGFQIYPYLTKWFTPEMDAPKPGYPSSMSKLTYTPDAARIYLKEGRRYRDGEVLVQADMGRTLRRIAEEGADVFYEGGIGKAIADDFKAHGGLFTYEDLVNWQPLYQDVAAGTYRGYGISTARPPATGVQMVEMLNILEHFDIASMDRLSPAYVDLLAKIMRTGFYDNVHLKNDPPYSVGYDMVRRYLSKEHAKVRAEKIKKGQAALGPLPTKPADTGTTHVTTVDGDGNVVSFTHSLGTLFGSGVVTPGLGFFFNNFMGHFNPLPGAWDSIVPHKKGGGGCPVLLLKDGKPFFVIGSPGGSRLISSILLSIINVVDHGMDAQTAVSVPRFHCEEEDLLFVEPTYPQGVVKELETMGWKVTLSNYMARMQAVLIGKDGKLYAGADPRGGQGVGSVR